MKFETSKHELKPRNEQGFGNAGTSPYPEQGKKRVSHGPTSKTYEGKQTNKRNKDEDKGQKHEGERNQIIKKRQTRRQKKTKQNQYDTAAYVFTFLRILSGTTFCSETQVLARRQIPERRVITCKSTPEPRNEPLRTKERTKSETQIY